MKMVEVPTPDGIQPMKLQIWDVFGQQGYSGVQRLSVSGASGAVLVCDGTRESTLINLATYWLPLIYEENWNIPFYIVENKNDLEDFVSRSELVSNISLLHTMSYPKTAVHDELLENYGVSSAKTGDGVEALFKILGNMILSSSQIEDPITDFLTSSRPKPTSEEPIDTPLQFLDNLIMEFLGSPGIDQERMRQMRIEIVRAGINISKPNIAGLETLVQYLADLEIAREGPEVVEARLRQRLQELAAIQG